MVKWGLSNKTKYINYNYMQNQVQIYVLATIKMYCQKYYESVKIHPVFRYIQSPGHSFTIDNQRLSQETIQ